MPVENRKRKKNQKSKKLPSLHRASPPISSPAAKTPSLPLVLSLSPLPTPSAHSCPSCSLPRRGPSSLLLSLLLPSASSPTLPSCRHQSGDPTAICSARITTTR
ncbi:hypothetical protein M0R45_007080 [Rubus argutus]|uniref:Uncharacterized protein n=1 Tax=Rubus argutus TaxID=59490 RepID=A0AAW1YSV2_RUBAR